jgi:hypothetical protein
MMTKETEIQSFIETMTEGGLDAIKADGGLEEPTLLFLTEKEGITDYQSMFIPTTIMNAEAGKDFVVEYVIPKVKRGLAEDGHNLLCVAFIAEVWRYQMPKGFNLDDQIKDDYRDKCEEKTEQVSFAFHLEDKSVNFMYPILRDADNNLIGFGEREIIENAYDISIGRFAKLF